MPDPELLPPPPPKKNVTTSELLPPPPKKKDYGGGDLGNGGSVFSDPFAFLIKEQPELHPKPQKVSGKTAPQEPTPFVKAVSFDKFLNKTIRINDNEEISIDPRTIPISPVISDNGDMFVYKVSKKVSEGKPLNDIEKKFINANKSPILSLSAYDIQSLDDFVTKNDISSAVLPESATALVPSMAGKTVGEASGSPEGRYAQVRALKEKLSENLLFLQKNLVFSPSDDEMKSMKTIMDELSELDNIETKLARQFTIVSDKGATALVSTDESGNSWNRFLGFIKNYGTLPSMLISDKNENVINKVNELPSEFMTGLNYVRFKEPVEFERVSRLLAEGKPISESQVAVLTNYGIDIERQKLKDQYADGKIDEAQYNVQNKELGNKAYENLLGNKEAGRAFFSSNIAEVLDLMNIEQPNITGTYTDYIFGHRWNYTAEEIEDAAKVVARVNNIDTSDARYKDIVKWLQDNEGAMIGKNSIYKAGWTRDLARGIIQPLSGVSKFIEAPFKTDEQQYAEGKSQGNVNITDIPVKRIADGWQGTVGKVLEGTGQLVSQIGLSYALAGGSMALGTAILGRAGTAALAGDIALADMSAGQIVGKTLLGSKDAIATYAMSYASTYDGYKKTAMNYTSDDATATAVAGGMAGLEGITENFLSPLDIARGVGKKIFGNPSFAKEAINIIDGVAVVNKEAAIKNIILKAVKESGNVILSEIGEEEVTQLADFGVNAMLNPNSQSFKDRNLWQEIGETAYQTGLSMVIPALASGVSAYNANNFAKGSLLIAAQNTQRFVDNLKLRLADNEIDQEQYNNFTQLINTAKVVNETLPQKVDGQKLNSNEKADYIFSRVSEAVLEKQKEKSKDAAEVNVLNQKIKEQQDFRTKILKNEGTKNAENNGNNQNAEGSQTDNTDNSQNTKVATSAENIKFEDKVRQVYPTLKNATDEEVNSFVTENAMDNPVQVLDKLGEDSFNEVIAKVPTEELQAKLDFLLSTDTENPNVEVLDGIIASREKEYTTPAVPLSEGNSALRDVENKINDVADEYLFHGTGEGAFRRIREEGMKSKSGGYLYFADTEQYATTYAQRKGNSFGDRVLRVKKSDAYEGDINTGLKGDFKIKGDIKPEDIEINDKGKWVPIQEYSDERIGILPLSKPTTNESTPTKEVSPKEGVSSNSNEVKKGVDKIFEENKDLSSIGTPQEYSQYLETVFPESKVKDIVYHGSDTKIDKFDKSKIGTGAGKLLGDGFYFTNDKKSIPFFVETVAGKNHTHTTAAILDLKNPAETKGLSVKRDSNNDGVVTSMTNEFVADRPDQIHILGSKEDIDGFKKWKAEQKPKQDNTVQPKAEGVSSNSNEGNSALRDVESKKSDISIGKIPNTEYEVKSDGVYFEGKKLNNPKNLSHRELIIEDIRRRKEESLELRNSIIPQVTGSKSYRESINDPNSINKGVWASEKEAEDSMWVEMQEVSDWIDSMVENNIPVQKIIDKVGKLIGIQGKASWMLLANERERLYQFIKAKVDGKVSDSLIDILKNSREKINAKYDAELEALSKPNSNEAKPKEAGKEVEGVSSNSNEGNSALEGKIETLNPTGSIFSDYTAEQRDKLPLGENITTYDKTAQVSPDEKIIVYRGVPNGVAEIKSGDFVTTNKQLAKDYAGTGKVISKEVSAKDILDDKTEPMGEEYILRENKKSKVEDNSALKDVESKTFIHETNADGFDEFDINKAGSGQGDNWLGKGVYLQEKGTLKIENYGKNKIEATLKPNAKIFETKDTPTGKYRDSFVDWAVENTEVGKRKAQERIDDGLSLQNLLPRDILKNNSEAVEKLKEQGYDGLYMDGELVVYNPQVLEIKKSESKLSKPNTNETKATTGTKEAIQHAKDIKDKFRETFKAKGNSDEHIDAAIAIMDARAKSWASEEKGRTPEQWYQRIADVKNGEFETSNILYQLADEVDLFSGTTAKEAKPFIDKMFASVKDKDEAKQIYRRLSSKYHPDRSTSKDATEIMQHLNSVKDNYDKGVKPKESAFSQNKSDDPLAAEWEKRYEEKLRKEKDQAINEFNRRQEKRRQESDAYSKQQNEYRSGMSIAQKVVAWANRNLFKEFTQEKIYKEYNNAKRDIAAKYKRQEDAVAAKYKSDLENARFKGIGTVKEVTEKQQSALNKIKENRSREENQAKIVYEELTGDHIQWQKDNGTAKGALETLSDGRVVIHALDAPDISTMVHEIFHVFEKDLTDAEKQQVKDFGGSEAFARAGERYLRDGNAPTKELQPLFEKFKQWLTDIYQSLKGSPISKKISPEIKQIFDRLLTSHEETSLSKSNTNEPAPTKEVITPETKKEEGNSELRDVKSTATPKAEERTFTKNALDRADAKKIYQQVREVDVPTDAEQIALEYIAIGGKVSESSINEVAGSVKRATLNTGRRDLKSSEAKTRDYSDKNAKSFDGIAHELWGIFEQRVSETDIKNALMDAVRDNTTRLDAAKSYLERYSPEYIEAKQQEKFYQEHLEEIEAEEKAINEWLNSENEIATEAIADINYVNSLISKYETENKGQDKQPATATESKTDKGVSNDASTQKTEKQKRIDDFNKKADKIANDLIDFLTPKSTRGAKTSGMGIADIINGATTAIKAAYAVSQNIKEAVDAGIKYFKDNWNTDELGELPEDALREKLTNDFEVPVEQIAKSVAKEIRDGNISYNDAKEGKSKEFIDELNKELFGSKKFNFDEDAFKEQIRKQKAIGITEEEVVELLSSSKKITKAQRAIISEVFGESAETDKLAADLKEAFNNLAKGEKPKMVLNRLSKSNITKLVDALRETLTYTPVSNKQLSKMADNIVESMDLNQAEDYLNAMINNSVLGLRQVLRAKLIVALGNEGKNELATNLVRDMADEAIQTGRHSQSLVLAYEILGAKANPAIRAEFERERVEVLQQKAAQMTHNYAKAISEQEVEIGKLNEKIHNMTQKSSAMNKIKEVINRLCGLRNKK